jgi:hypothetical protein
MNQLAPARDPEEGGKLPNIFEELPLAYRDGTPFRWPAILDHSGDILGLLACPRCITLDKVHSTNYLVGDSHFRY